MASLTWFRVVAASDIGMIAWRGQLWTMPLSILVPCLIAVQPSRATAGATSFASYAAASLSVVGVAKAYWPCPHRRAASLHHRLGVAAAMRRRAVSKFGLVRHRGRFGTPRLVDPEEDPVDHIARRGLGRRLPEYSGSASQETNRLGRRDDADPPSTERGRSCRFAY